MEGALRAEEPRLASMFDMFTRLVPEERRPPAERQFRADGRWRTEAFARQRARRLWCLILIVLLAPLLAAVIAELC